MPLILEYEAAGRRIATTLKLGMPDIDEILNYFCSVGERHRIHYLWRPQLPDPKDDMILELAVAAQAEAIVTFNRRHFGELKRFGIKVITPQELLFQIGEGK